MADTFLDKGTTLLSTDKKHAPQAFHSLFHFIKTKGCLPFLRLFPTVKSYSWVSPTSCMPPLKSWAHALPHRVTCWWHHDSGIDACEVLGTERGGRGREGPLPLPDRGDTGKQERGKEQEEGKWTVSQGEISLAFWKLCPRMRKLLLKTTVP